MEGLDFAVRATDARFLEMLRGYLAGCRTEDGDRDVLFSADCGVAKALPGGKAVRGVARLWFGSLAVFRGPIYEEMAGRLIGCIRDMATAHSNEFVRIRAAGVVLDGGALIMPSPPEAHLPALAALLVREGAGYLGDEIVNVEPVLRDVHGIGLPLLVDAADIGLFPELGREPRRQRPTQPPEILEAKTPRRPVTLDELGGRTAEPAPARWIVFPSFEPGAVTELVPVGRAEAVFLFTAAALNLHIWGDRTFVLLQELLGGASVARLVIGSMHDAVRLRATSLPEAPAPTATGR